MSADEIERFRRERVERTGDAREADNITDQDLLREVMNTVGKEGRLGQSIRCVVSVSMLTEGWDANTVTHVLGVRAFGTQLLCEQVIGRALRRQSYELNDNDPLRSRVRRRTRRAFRFHGKAGRSKASAAPPNSASQGGYGQTGTILKSGSPGYQAIVPIRRKKSLRRNSPTTHTWC